MKEIPINESKKNKDVDFKELAKKFFIDVTKKIDFPPVALSKGEHSYGTQSFPTPICTYGNFSAIAGPSKTMKTYLKSALVSGYVGGQSNNYFPDLKGHESQGKWVVDIDTEQSPFDAQRVAKRVLKMVGGGYEYYLPFGLREMSFKERFQFIEWVFLESDWKDNLGFVSIDGAADLLSNANDLEASNNITNSFLKWTSKSSAHLLTVIHNNFESNKPTGHLGSSITKKAETVLKVSRNIDDHTIEVIPQYTRNRPFESFSFGLNADGLPKETEYGF